MHMTKAELIEYVRIAEHNQDAAETALRQQNEMVHVLRSEDGRRGLKWQDGSYMSAIRHSAAIAECGCRLQDIGVVKGQMRELLRTIAHPAERK